MGICCMAQKTLTGALYQPRGVGWGGLWEGGSKGRGYMFTYGWFALRFDRRQQNSVKPLSFNKKLIKKKKREEKMQRKFFPIIYLAELIRQLEITLRKLATSNELLLK